MAWSVSFSTFVAIVSKEHPDKFRELLAYHATILIEALHFGCKGWLSYDKLFREDIEKEPKTHWSMLHPMFYSLSFLSQRVEALTCPRCTAPDHSKSECTLSTLEPVQEPPRVRQPETGRQPGPPRKRFRHRPRSLLHKPPKSPTTSPLTRDNASGTPSLANRSTNASVAGRITAWWIARPRLFPLPHECGGVSELGLTTTS